MFSNLIRYVRKCVSPADGEYFTLPSITITYRTQGKGVLYMKFQPLNPSSVAYNYVEIKIDQTSFLGNRATVRLNQENRVLELPLNSGSSGLRSVFIKTPTTEEINTLYPFFQNVLGILVSMQDLNLSKYNMQHNLIMCAVMQVCAAALLGPKRTSEVINHLSHHKQKIAAAFLQSTQPHFSQNSPLSMLPNELLEKILTHALQNEPSGEFNLLCNPNNTCTLHDSIMLLTELISELDPAVSRMNTFTPT